MLTLELSFQLIFTIMNLMSLYIAAAIFGAGVLLIDLFGVFASIGEDGDGDGDHGGNDSTEDGGEGDADNGADAHGGESDGSVIMHSKKSSKFKIIKMIGWLRSLVYFSLGFGAVGWFAVATDKSLLASLLWSVPSGIVFALVAKLVKKLQRQELDSQFKSYELLLSVAEVIVPIPKGQIGKVRIEMEGINVERYAKAQNQEDTFAKGENVRVVEVSEDFLYVEQE
jgi:membrane protein implicated in regulation of membrane protease activity